MPSPPALRNPVGTHLKVGSGPLTGLLPRARALGVEVLQLFVGNPRGWALSAGDPAADAAFRQACAAEAVRVVVHTGSCADEGSSDAALRQVREGLLPVLEALDPTGPWLLLEPTAGQGRSLCATVAELGPYLDALDRHPRVGICFDTCHAFAAGEPLDQPGGTTDTLDRLVAVAGRDRLRLVHVNDSEDPRGSSRDRHAPIGTGRIGVAALTELLAHPATAGVPLVLETPGSRDPGDPQLPLLKALRDTAGAAAPPAAGSAA